MICFETKERGVTFCQFSPSLPWKGAELQKESRFGYLDDDDALTLPLGLFTFFLHLPSLKIQSLKNTAIFTHPFHIYRVNEDTHTHTHKSLSFIFICHSSLSDITNFFLSLPET